MAQTKNIFDVLNVGQDSDDETQVQQKPAKNQQKSNQNKDDSNRNKGNTSSNTTEDVSKEQRNKNVKKTQPKEKGVSDEPHPKDRQSGSKYDGALQKNKFRKGGAGNVGTVKDELTRDVEVNQDNSEDDANKETAEQKPAYKTIQEYYQEIGVTLNENESQEEKRVRVLKEKDIEDQLKKEKLQYVRTKEEIRQEQTTGKTQSQKAKGPRLDYKASFQSEKAELLGFRTGLVEVVESDRPKRTRDEKPVKKDDKPATEETSKPTEGETQGETQERGNRGENRGDNNRGDNNRGGNRGDNNRGGNRGDNNRGGNRGDNNRGDNNRGGNRGDNQERKGGYKGGNRNQGKGFQVKDNAEDFPTLG